MHICSIIIPVVYSPNDVPKTMPETAASLKIKNGLNRSFFAFTKTNEQRRGFTLRTQKLQNLRSDTAFCSPIFNFYINGT